MNLRSIRAMASSAPICMIGLVKWKLSSSFSVPTLTEVNDGLSRTAVNDGDAIPCHRSRESDVSTMSAHRPWRSGVKYHV